MQDSEKHVGGASHTDKRSAVESKKAQRKSGTASDVTVEHSELDAKAKEVQGLDKEIIESDKENMKKALAVGKIIVWGKKELKRLNVRSGLRNWIENGCHVPYKRAYNYKRVYEAALKDATIKRMGLTEAYVQLRLVKRTPKPSGADSAPAPVVVKNPDTAAIPPAAPVVPVIATIKANLVAKRRKIAKYEVVKHADAYVLEIDDDWQNTLLEVIADIENCTAVLNDGGLLLRLKHKPDAGRTVAVAPVA